MPENKEMAIHLKRAVTRLVKVLRKEMRKDDNFSLTELSTLGSIYRHKAITPSELANKEKVTIQSMSQIIKKFSGDGYIQKTPSEKDKRKVIITMTLEGKTLVEERIHKKQEWLARAIAEKTSKSEQEVLRQAVDILTKLADS